MLICKYCGRECKNDNSLRNHERLCKQNPNRQIANLENLNSNEHKKDCLFCNKSFSIGNIKRHEISCDKNPLNFKECPVCKKTHTKSGVTCSYSCSNTFFREKRNKPENYKNYSTICWKHHKKECIVCGENKIVAVHHLNENHSDNRPENLIPLCPTHHQYVHSRYKGEIEPHIQKYLDNYTSV